MKKLITIMFVLAICFTAIPAMADLTSHHVAYYYDDVSKDFYISGIWERDFYEYQGKESNADAEDFREYIERFHEWYCGGCYSGGPTRHKTLERADDYMAGLAKTFHEKGYEIHWTEWTP